MKLFTRLVAILGVVVICGCPSAPAPFLELAGWTPQDEAASYDAAGLWELINGAADVFLAYGFDSVTVQRFTAGDRVVSVSVYDMGTPLNAFGIYRTEAPRDVPVLPIGTETVMSPPYQVLLVKDRYYVKVDAYEGELDEDTGESLAESIAAAIPGTTELPPQFAVLPEDGRIPGTAEYTKSGYLGVAGLDECVHGGYRDESGSEYRVFAVVATPERDLDTAWSGLAESWQAAELDESEVLYREVPYSGLVGVVRVDGGVVGVADAADLDQLLARLRELTD